MLLLQKEGKVIFAVGEFTTGINISSSVDITLKSVSVYSQNQITVVVPVVVWSGEHDLESWNGTSIEYTAEAMSKTTVGSTLRFFYKDKTEGAQLQFAGQATIDVTDNSGYVDMSVTDALITELAGGWPWMSCSYSGSIIRWGIKIFDLKLRRYIPIWNGGGVFLCVLFLFFLLFLYLFFLNRFGIFLVSRESFHYYPFLLRTFVFFGNCRTELVDILLNRISCVEETVKD